MISAIPYRLGLDLGASSLGWAVVKLDKPGGDPISIMDSGVRIFEAGVEGDIEQGKDSSRAVKRREARQPRRQNWRTQNRKRKLFSLLQELKLLPTSENNNPLDRKATLDNLDESLRENIIKSSDTSDESELHDLNQKLPYLLRAKAVEETVEKYELGRALYHLAQRRGYLSNRKGQSDDEDLGIVESSIEELQDKRHGRTNAQYFVEDVNPDEERIRRRYLGRKDNLDEFERIRDIQGNRQKLTDKDWQRIHQAIFYQRPLKSQKHLIGRCELEPKGKKWKHRRCDLCLPVAQEFRILQKVNDLRVFTSERYNDPLSPEERKKLIETLWTKEKMTWSQVKTALKLPRNGTRFSIEEWDDKLIGHRTNYKMMKSFGKRWLKMPEEEQTSIVREVLHYRKPEALKKRAMKVWGLNEEQAEKLSKTHLEEDHASHSRQALRKLIDGDDKHKGMKDGIAYATVRRALYPETFTSGKGVSSLPPVNDWKKDIRNPAVIRALTETRKVVNALIRKYGKPHAIHIELARDMRNSRQKRKDISKKNEENRKRRENAKEKLILEGFTGNHSRTQVEKWLLAEECNFECPYCGKTINGRQLMGDDAEFNIEHIFPRRYLDNSYLNKTIACRSCNDHKGDRTPAQAYSDEKLQTILQRVSRFQGTARDIKLSRFKTEKPDEDFVARQLNDTRYNSKLAAEYLGLLFGGRNDKDGNQRIVSPTGAITGKVRAMWQLNDLLSETDEKSRDDHRHHAVDAIVVALIGQRLIGELSRAAERAEEIQNRHFFNTIPFPWDRFKNDVAFSLEAIRVSHRPTRTISGPLHAESIYSQNYGTKKKPEYRIRKELAKLTPKEVKGDQIIDKRVREAVQAKYEELGGGAPNRLWSDRDAEENFPRLVGEDGGLGSVIRKVRLRTSAKPRSIGKGPRERNVAAGKDSNYASMIYAILDEQGNEIKWEHEIITRLEAHERLSANHGQPGEKILIPEETETRKFKFALRKNDMVEADGPDGDRVLYRVQKMSVREIQLCEHTHNIVKNDQRTPWNRISSIDSLRKRNVLPLEIDIDGEIII